MKKYIYKITIALLAIGTFAACNDSDDGYNGGKPEIRYIRPCDIALSDSLLTSAFLGNEIAVIGENLGGVNAIYFNDQKAKLNPNFVTNNSIIVTIPNGIPTVKQDIIKFCTSKDTVIYTFETKVPAPSINSMDCEYVADGDIAVIHGLYFVDDGGSPLEVYFSGGVRANVISSDLNTISVEVPVGATPGPVTVTSVYGTSESSLWFRDNRNIILSFNNGISPDYDYFHGWHGAKGVATDGGINGNYLILKGDIDESGGTADGDFCFDKWTYNPVEDPDAVDATQLDKYVLKFEVNVQNAWSAAAMQFIFTGAEEVWCNWQDNSNPDFAQWTDTHGGNETWKAGDTYPRALWMPWVDNGSYSTNGWTTVTIPMTDFNKSATGESLVANGSRHWTGINIWVGQGGAKGTACSPTIWIDNVRVVKK